VIGLLFLMQADFDKEKRKSVHGIMKQHMPFLISDFQDGCVFVRYLKKGEKPGTTATL
jgi:hypothetical protein